MIDALKPITDADDALIRNIGHVSESILNEAEEKSMQPLSNGYCAKTQHPDYVIMRTLVIRVECITLQESFYLSTNANFERQGIIFKLRN